MTERSLSLFCCVNFAGRNRAYLGWGAIHIAAYFGHLQALKLLLKVGGMLFV